MTAQPVALSRRRFLVGAGASAAGALALPSLWPRYAFATPGEPATGDALVVVFLRGGADGLSLVPPFSDTTGYQALRGAGTAGSVAVAAPNASNPAAALDLAGHPVRPQLRAPPGDERPEGGLGRRGPGDRPRRGHAQRGKHEPEPLRGHRLLGARLGLAVGDQRLAGPVHDQRRDRGRRPRHRLRQLGAHEPPWQQGCHGHQLDRVVQRRGVLGRRPRQRRPQPRLHHGHHRPARAAGGRHPRRGGAGRGREPAAVRHPRRPLPHRMAPASGWARACARWRVCSVPTSACASPASTSTAGTTTTPWARRPAG